MFFVEGWWSRVNERLVNQAKCGVVLFLLLLLLVEVLFARTLIVIEQAQLPFLDPVLCCQHSTGTLRSKPQAALWPRHILI